MGGNFADHLTYETVRPLFWWQVPLGGQVFMPIIHTVSRFLAFFACGLTRRLTLRPVGKPCSCLRPYPYRAYLYAGIRMDGLRSYCYIRLGDRLLYIGYYFMRSDGRFFLCVLLSMRRLYPGRYGLVPFFVYRTLWGIKKVGCFCPTCVRDIILLISRLYAGGKVWKSEGP